MTNSAAISAATTESQMPFMPSRWGNTRMAVTWNTRVRRKEITADTMPLLSAVKNAEPKMLKPQSRKLREYSFMPRVVTLVAAVVVLAAAGGGIWLHHRKTAETESAAAVYVSTVAELNAANPDLTTLCYSGVTEAQETKEIKADTSKTIAETYVKELASYQIL